MCGFFFSHIGSAFCSLLASCESDPGCDLLLWIGNLGHEDSAVTLETINRLMPDEGFPVLAFPLSETCSALAPRPNKVLRPYAFPLSFSPWHASWIAQVRVKCRCENSNCGQGVMLGLHCCRQVVFPKLIPSYSIEIAPQKTKPALN